MKTLKYLIVYFIWPVGAWAAIVAGAAAVDITPPVDTPSAGHAARQGCGMSGVRDPLLATALYLKADGQELAWCGVDHLGMTYDMVQEVVERVGRPGCKILVSSSHTHSGSGGFLPFGGWSEQLAGKFDQALRERVISGCVTAVIEAMQDVGPAKLGVGMAPMGLNVCRGLCGEPRKMLTLIKVEDEEGEPKAALFVWPCHPTCLGAENRCFSADFVGQARKILCEQLGPDCIPIYVNGAQGNVLPTGSCDEVGKALGEAVVQLWPTVCTSGSIDLEVTTSPYRFKVQPTVCGLRLPVEEWASELNLLKIGGDLFLTVGGELSCIYDEELIRYAGGSLTICGLTNDAHGYMITPEAWRSGGVEARTSFGGPNYGEEVVNRAKELLQK